MTDMLDRSPDSLFYSEPRFVTHIDDPAIRALTKYYSEVFPPSNSSGVCLVDLCSSWVSKSWPALFGLFHIFSSVFHHNLFFSFLLDIG